MKSKQNRCRSNQNRVEISNEFGARSSLERSNGSSCRNSSKVKSSSKNNCRNK